MTLLSFSLYKAIDKFIQYKNGRPSCWSNYFSGFNQFLNRTLTFDCTSIIVGTSKANRDWTPLHLSSYFGHTSTVKILVEVRDS